MAHASNWFEIPVADLERAMRFYAALTGQALTLQDMGVPGEALAIFGSEDDEVGGALLRSPHATPAQAGTMVYLNAGPNLDVWLARVPAAGGQVVVPRTELPPGMGVYAHIVDSEGNRVGLHSPA
jgi:hypothetical protein